MTILSSLAFGFLVFAMIAMHLKFREERRINEENIKRLEEIIKNWERGYAAVFSALEQEEGHTEAYRSHIDELKLQLEDAAQAAERKAAVWIKQESERIRSDAVAKSRQVLKGFSSENFAPFDMEFNPRDFRHLGDPIDYLVFSGGTSIKDGDGDTIEEIILLDIKTGEADLNKTQRRIRDAVVNGKISFATYNMDTRVFRRYTNK